MSLAASTLISAAGCNHQRYAPQPFQALRLERDVRAHVSFNVAGPDGKPLRVESVQTLRAGGFYKLMTPDELKRANPAAK